MIDLSASIILGIAVDMLDETEVVKLATVVIAWDFVVDAVHAVKELACVWAEGTSRVVCDIVTAPITRAFVLPTVDLEFVVLALV